MPFILQTSGLSKKIGSKALVTDVNIHIPKGEIYGFLGPNGAGKTTVMKMITNLWKPTSGTIEVFGEVLTPKSYEVLKRMGSIIEFPTFYDHMTGRENLQLHCEYMGYYNVDSVESALQMLDLTSAADQPVKNYSLGMKERLGIARAIMCKPELLILDEPTNGLDPAGMKQIRDLLKTLCSEYGITVMISSHILSEVESIADTVAIIHHGKMMKEMEEIQTSDKWEHIPTHKSSGNIAAPSLCFLLPDNTHRPSPVPSPHPFPASRWMHFSSSETKLDIHVDALAISRSLLFPLLPMQTLHGHCPAYNKHRSLQCLLSHSLLPPPQGWLFLLRQRDLRFYHPAHKSE